MTNEISANDDQNDLMWEKMRVHNVPVSGSLVQENTQCQSVIPSSNIKISLGLMTPTRIKSKLYRKKPKVDNINAYKTYVKIFNNLTRGVKIT